MALEVLQFIAIDNRLSIVADGFDRLNLGGLSELYLFRPPDFFSLPSYNYHFDSTGKAQISGSENIELKNGTNFYRLRFTADTGSAEESDIIGDDGILYRNIIKAKFAKNRPELAWLRQKMGRRRYTAVYRDQNGLVQIIGTAQMGLSWTWKSETGSQANNFNGMSLQGKLDQLAPSPFWAITGEVTDNITIL